MLVTHLGSLWLILAHFGSSWLTWIQMKTKELPHLGTSFATSNRERS